MEKLTHEQKLVLTGFTGVMMVDNFSDFHKDLEERLGRPVFTHELVDHNVFKEAYRKDFMSLVTPE